MINKSFVFLEDRFDSKAVFGYTDKQVMKGAFLL